MELNHAHRWNEIRFNTGIFIKNLPFYCIVTQSRTKRSLPTFNMRGISLSLQHEVKGGRRNLIFPSLLCRNHIKACSNRRTGFIQEESTSQTSVNSSFCNQEGTSLFSVYFCFNCRQTGASQKQSKFWEQALLVLHG